MKGARRGRMRTEVRRRAPGDVSGEIDDAVGSQAEHRLELESSVVDAVSDKTLAGLGEVGGGHDRGRGGVREVVEGRGWWESREGDDQADVKKKASVRRARRVRDLGERARPRSKRAARRCATERARAAV